MDSAFSLGQHRGGAGRTGRQASHRDAQEPPESGVGVTGETEVALTEEFEMMSTASARGGPGSDDADNRLPSVLELGETPDLGRLPGPPGFAEVADLAESGELADVGDLAESDELPPSAARAQTG